MCEQQNTAVELDALSAQWKELCEKNIEIQAACAQIENHIEEMRREAAERYSSFPYLMVQSCVALRKRKCFSSRNEESHVLQCSIQG